MISKNGANTSRGYGKPHLRNSTAASRSVSLSVVWLSLKDRAKACTHSSRIGSSETATGAITEDEESQILGVMTQTGNVSYESVPECWDIAIALVA